MKLLLIIATLNSAQVTFADSFMLTKDGKEYLCEQTAIDPYGAVECINKAYNGPFTRDEATQICQGAKSTAAAECAIKAYIGPFTKAEAISLCSGSKSESAADCATKAYNGPFTKAESLRLCQRGTVANADCAIKAYNGPFTKEEAIAACQEAGTGLVINGQKFVNEMQFVNKLNLFKSKLNIILK